ncbi:translation initiation factor [Neolewinella antarctica]|uniref:Translation initiation factor 1 n=1 Tax=Neolewinella antarctica TaxID=442734 RepID=A0ABX0X7E6_9BACT|nr:translation initiation factor [Neolewinella antarctica]NJC25135.1 translation initiation factor 1 [Neolewinella antarctica]
MAKKKKSGKGLSFSTGDAGAADNPFAALSGLGDLPQAPASSVKLDEDTGAAAGAGSDGRAKMPLRVSIDRKYRRGKEVTLVTGYAGPESDLQDLAKLLKKRCGVGGSVKDGEIVVQGNKRDRVMEILAAEGYASAKKSGG